MRHWITSFQVVDYSSEDTMILDFEKSRSGKS